MKYFFYTFFLVFILSNSLYGQNSYSISGYIHTWKGEPAKGVWVRCRNIPDVLEFSVTDENGFYQFEGIPEEQEYTIAPIPNQNDFQENLTLLDGMAVYCYINELIPLSQNQVLAANVDASSYPDLRYHRLSIADTWNICDVAMGYYDEFTLLGSKSWAYIPEVYELPPLTQDTVTQSIGLENSIFLGNLNQNMEQLNFIGYKRGDVMDEADFSLDTLPTPSFSFPNIISCNDTISVPVLMDSEDGIIAFQFTVQWNPSVLKFAEYENAHPEINLPNIWSWPEETTDGQLTVGWLTRKFEGILTDGVDTIFLINFEPIASQGESTEIIFSDVSVKKQVVAANCVLANPTFISGSVTIGYEPAICGTVDYPLPNFEAPDTICVGECFEVTNLCQSQALSWQWTMEGADVSFSEEQSPGLICYHSPGRFRIEQTIEAGLCQASYEHWIEVVEPSTVFAFEPVQRLCDDRSLFFDATSPNAVAYLWDNGSTSPVRIIEEEGLYYLTLTDAYCSRKDSILVQKCGKVYVPNSFSPNSDGINDHFEVFSHNAQVLSIEVYNRWGSLIYSEEEAKWDGKIKGKQAEEGTYVYVLKYLDLQNNEEQLITGNLLLLR